MAKKKNKERPEEPLGAMSYQTKSKRSPPFWLLIGARKTQVFWQQSEARTLSPGALLAVLYFSSCLIFPPVQTFPRPHYLPLGLRGRYIYRLRNALDPRKVSTVTVLDFKKFQISSLSSRLKTILQIFPPQRQRIQFIPILCPSFFFSFFLSSYFRKSILRLLSQSLFPPCFSFLIWWSFFVLLSHRLLTGKLSRNKEKRQGKWEN